MSFKTSLFAIVWLVCVVAAPVIAATKTTVQSDIIQAGPVVDVRAFKNLSTAKANPKTAGRRILITNIQSVNNLTIPSDRAIEIVPGGGISVASGKTCTINGDFQAGRGQVFTGAGSVVGLSLVIPEWFGVKYDGSSANDTTLLAKAVAAVAARGVLLFGPGTYKGNLLIARSHINIQGAGSSVTTIKLPDGVDSNVIDIGIVADYSYATKPVGINISGLTLDGNKTATPQPTSDLTSWGLGMSWVTHSRVSDIRVVNCWTGGIGVLVHSDYNQFDGIYTANTGGNPHSTGCGLDFNSASYNVVSSYISSGDSTGMRILDDSRGNIVNATIQDAVATGAVFNNQIVGTNNSYGNYVTALIRGGCSVAGAQIGARFNSSQFDLNIVDVVGIGLLMPKQTVGTDNPISNRIYLSTRNCGNAPAIIGGDDNDITIKSYLDYRTGTALGIYAVTVSGKNNSLNVMVTDSSTEQIRSISFDATSSNNIVNSFIRKGSDTYALIDDYGTDNTIVWNTGKGRAVASSATLTVPVSGDMFTVSGTTGISDMYSGGQYGRTVTLLFQGALTVQAANRLKINGNFITKAGSTLTLYSDGTNWYEKGRSLN